MRYPEKTDRDRLRYITKDKDKNRTESTAWKERGSLSETGPKDSINLGLIQLGEKIRHTI